MDPHKNTRRFPERRQADRRPASTDVPPSLGEVRQIATDVLRPPHFYVGTEAVLEWHHQATEEISWEIYRGRLLEPAHTRLRRSFETWSIFGVEGGERSAEPVLSLKLDGSRRQLHVTRAIYCYGWEGYDAGGSIFLSRETRKWVCELVGTVELDQFAELDELRDELICLLFQAVVGGSRLPLSSVEAPLPAFSLGQLAYFYQPCVDERGSSMASYRDLLRQGFHEDLTWLEKAKLLEIVLRGVTREEIEPAAEHFMDRWRVLGHSPGEVASLCRTVFNEVALSPYTEFVDRFLDFWRTLVARGHLPVEDYVDFLSYLLRQNARHLTAYDLITFHHRGANYPDALLLDVILKTILVLIESNPEWFLPAAADDAFCQKRKRMRRRALRQGWLLWHLYEGLPVPDFPTSPGENARVLPPPFGRMPEEQILETSRRTKLLFAGERLTFTQGNGHAVLRQSIADLQHGKELQELGMAVFLDRPLGVGKAPGEPDQTLFVSYQAFSRSVAERRLKFLEEHLGLIPNRKVYEAYRNQLLTDLRIDGIALPCVPRMDRPGAVSVHDALKSAADFLFLRTTRQATRDFLDQFDFAPLGQRFNMDYFRDEERVLILRETSPAPPAEGLLLIYDSCLRPRLELQVDLSLGYRRRAGREYPGAGLRVLRVWDAVGDQLQEEDVREERITVQPRG